MTARALLYVLPLALLPGDAFAWGLQTHLFFAQYALLFAPLADPQLRCAVARFPRLVLAGACLPDLALAGRAIGTPAFRCAHRWSTLRRLAAAPPCDEEHALAIGYATHLLADVVAHNRFVPEHEARIAGIPHITHAICEWAMDMHVATEIDARVADVLTAERHCVVDFVARGFRCRTLLADRATRWLAKADALLRASPLPRLCRRAVALVHGDVPRVFDAYLRTSARTLAMLECALGGALIDWVSLDPEGSAGDCAADSGASHDIARIVQSQHDT
jgi:hypothetical protein